VQWVPADTVEKKIQEYTAHPLEEGKTEDRICTLGDVRNMRCYCPHCEIRGDNPLLSFLYNVTVKTGE
jgi:hypothetical protein